MLSLRCPSTGRTGPTGPTGPDLPDRRSSL